MSLFITEDGSHSFLSSKFNVPYHSKYGARTESEHVFIAAGLQHFHQNHPDREVRILEYGIGTGLNALLTFHYLKDNKNVNLSYTGIEKYPFVGWGELNYTSEDLSYASGFFEKFHVSPFGQKMEFENLSFKKTPK